MDDKTGYSYLVRFGFPGFIVAISLSFARLSSADTQSFDSRF